MSSPEPKTTEDKPKSAPGSKSSLLVEAVKVSPQFFWAVVVLISTLALGRPLLHFLETGRVTEITISTFSVKLADVGGADGFARAGPEDLTLLDRRGAQLADIADGKRILWVDDKHPKQNISERQALEEFGLSVHIVRNTKEAIQFLELYSYAAVITDLNRPNQEAADCDSKKGDALTEGSDFANAGCAFLETMNDKFGKKMPRMIIYASNSDIALGIPPYARGMTNRVDELVHLIFDAIERIPGE